MSRSHKNKTFATFLAILFGGLGLHRFYIAGGRDFWGWVHLASVPLSLLLMFGRPDMAWIFAGLPLIVSSLSGLLAGLVIGLTPDEKWDAACNQGSGRSSDSGWLLAVLLVLGFGTGAVGLIAVIARSFDLLFTGGSFG